MNFEENIQLHALKLKATVSGQGIAALGQVGGYSFDALCITLHHLSTWREIAAVPGRRPRPANEHRARSKAANRSAKPKAVRRGGSWRAGEAVSTSPGLLRVTSWTWGIAPYPKTCYAFVTASLLTKR